MNEKFVQRLRTEIEEIEKAGSEFYADNHLSRVKEVLESLAIK